MKNSLIVLFTVGSFVAYSVHAEQPIQLSIPKDYAKTGVIAINGKTVPSHNVLDQLMMLAIHQGENVPIAVILPDSLRFTDWNNVRGLLWKVGFSNIRFFVQSSSTGKMVELQQVGPAIDKVPDQ